MYRGKLFGFPNGPWFDVVLSTALPDNGKSYIGTRCDYTSKFVIFPAGKSDQIRVEYSHCTVGGIAITIGG